MQFWKIGLRQTDGIMFFLFNKQPSVDSRHLIMLVMSMAVDLLFGLLHIKVVLIREKNHPTWIEKTQWTCNVLYLPQDPQVLIHHNHGRTCEHMWTLSSLSWSMSCSNFSISSSVRSATSCIACRWAAMTSAAGAAMVSTTAALPATSDPQLQALLGNLNPTILNHQIAADNQNLRNFSGWCRTSTSKPQETKKKKFQCQLTIMFCEIVLKTCRRRWKNILRTSQNYEKLRNSHVDSGNSYEFVSRRFWVFPRWIWEFPRWVRVANFSGFETLISPGCRNYEILTSTPRILTSNPSFLTSSLGYQLKLQKMHFQELSTTISNPYSRGISTGNANFHLFGTCRWILPRT